MDAGTGRRIAKVLGLVLGGLVALCLLALLAVWLFVKPNEYKGRIARAVQESTGRELRLDGDIKLSLFPWVALELGPAELGNPAGFGGKPFLALQHASIRARLWPLLHRSLVIGRIDIDGLEVRLQKNAAGKGNWEGFGAASDAPTGGAPPARPAGRLEGLDGIRLTHGRLSIDDLVLDQLTLETGRFVDGSAVPIALALQLQPGAAAGAVGIAAKLNLSPDFAAQKYAVAALDVSGTVALTHSGRSVTWKVTAPALVLDMMADTLSLPAFTAQLAGAQALGAVQVTHLTQALGATGSITLQAFDLRQWLARLDAASPETRDPRALTQFAAAAAFKVGGNAARIGPLDVTLDDTHLRGVAGVTHLDGPRSVTFDLTADRLDVDRYLGPAKPDPAPAPPAAASPPAAAAGKREPLQASGTLAVGALTVAGVAVSNLKVTVNAMAGVTHLYPAQADLYRGHYSGNITLDQRAAVPAVSLDEHLHGIDIAQLLADRLKTKRLSGRGNLDIRVSARGAGSDAMLRSANGRVDAHLADGAVEGVDLGYEIGLAQALIEKTTPPQTQNTGRTTFDSFKASALLGNGVASIQDLNIASSYLRVSGGGSANLLTQALDLKLLASILKAPAGAGRTVSLADIPVQISGSAADPKVRLDLEGLAKTQLKQKVQDKLQDVLKDKLQDLFGK